MKRLTINLILLLAISLVPNGVQGQSIGCINSPDAEFLEGTWVGEFTQYACGVDATYPMTLEVKRIDENEFSGFFIWQDLPDEAYGKTTMTGTYRGDSLVMTESSLLYGQDLVLNGLYETRVQDCEHLNGYWHVDSLQPDCPDPKTLIDGGRYFLRKMTTHKAEENLPEPEKRVVVLKDHIVAHSDYITLKLWDKYMEDGDIITLLLNKEVILEKAEVKKKAVEIIVPLPKDVNVIELFAENIGKTPPNTAAIAVISNGEIIKELILKSDFNTTEAIQVVKKGAKE